MSLGSKIDKSFSVYDIKDMFMNIDQSLSVQLDLEFEHLDLRGLNEMFKYNENLHALRMSLKSYSRKRVSFKPFKDFFANNR